MQIKILKHLKPEFDKRLAKVNKKLVKHNLSPITISSCEESITYKTSDEIEFKTGVFKTYPIYWFDIDLISPLEEFKINGYTFYGCISLKDGVKQIFAANEKAQTKLLEFVDISRCDHCHVNRFRTRTFIFEKESQFFVIGSGCVKDYLGTDIERTLAKGLESIKELSESPEDDENFSHHFKYYEDFNSVLMLAIYSIEKHHGYLKNGVTASEISYLLRKPDTNDSQVVHEWQKEKDTFLAWANESKSEIAKKIREHWNQITPQSSFEFNIKELFTNCVSKSFSLIACGVNIYYRMNNLFPNKPSDKKSSVHVGTIGEKLEMELKVLRYIPYDSQYGSGNIILMENSDGNIIKWKTGIVSLPEESFRAKMTIKRHEEYKGTKQTQVQRLKVL